MGCGTYPQCHTPLSPAWKSDGWQPVCYTQVARGDKLLGVTIQAANGSGKCVDLEESFLRQVGNAGSIILYSLRCVCTLLPLNLPSSFSLISISIN